MKYRHYKGAIYELIATADHTETGEELVIYKDEEGRGWARPKKIFFENVVIDGEERRRFQPLEFSE
jgi:hypothetical protein